MAQYNHRNFWGAIKNIKRRNKEYHPFIAPPSYMFCLCSLPGLWSTCFSLRSAGDLCGHYILWSYIYFYSNLKMLRLRFSRTSLKNKTFGCFVEFLIISHSLYHQMDFVVKIICLLHIYLKTQIDCWLLKRYTAHSPFCGCSVAFYFYYYYLFIIQHIQVIELVILFCNMLISHCHIVALQTKYPKVLQQQKKLCDRKCSAVKGGISDL